MKHLHLVLSLSLVAFIATSSIAAADSFDSDTATIKKDGAHNAKVQLDKKTYIVPVSFGDSADWSSVKDHYELSDQAAAAIKSGKGSIAIGSDGSVATKKK